MENVLTVGPIEHEVEVESFASLKTKMSTDATNIIAATIIANKAFPKQSTLPLFCPLPFQNFGHFYLFNHKQFLKIIYQAVQEIKGISKQKKYTTPALLWGIGSFVMIGLLMFLLFQTEELVPLHFLPPIMIGLITYSVISSSTGEKLNKEIAAYKADCLERLLNNNWEEKANVEGSVRLLEILSYCGTPSSDRNAHPILIVFSDDHPFPGFGCLQLETKFFCPPKDYENTVPKDEAYLMQAVINKLQNALSICGIENIGFGKVVVLNHDSITIDSAWLDENKYPLLEKVFEDLDAIYTLDKKASVRQYFMVEILFPKYASGATFFIRMFKAGNSIGCHIALTTIGPPQLGEPYIQNRLKKFKIESNNKIIEPTPATTISKSEALLNYMTQRYNEKFHEPISLEEIRGLDPLDEEHFDLKEYKGKEKEIVEKEISWPGKYRFYRYNIREEESLTFGGDFFGFPELQGTIYTAYEQISKLVLDCIEEHGYDISKYKDKEGRYSINAEKIDKIIVGEVINMKDEDRKADSKPSSEKGDGGKKVA